MKECSRGFYLVRKSNPIFPDDRPLVVIVYKYRSQKFLGFTSTEDAISTEIGVTYLSRYPENYSSVSIHPVFCHRVIGRHFSDCKAIDNHNRMRQSDAALDKYWAT